MRRAEQKRISELLQTLDEAHTELRKQLSQQVALQLLADCLDFALRVAGYIESVAGEGTRTAALLAEYCELLRRADTGGDGTGAKRAKTLQTQLLKVKNAALEELAPDRIEVVFITWRAMQFDALESVYRAAAADPSCDAFVVPVPYYEVNSDGSLGRMHYEGAEFYRAPHYHPDTETVHWQEYDIEARRPDAIFVNNPYDGNVRNACIHPDYFCERLRGLTDLLVYIPYFITGDDVTEEFCTLPGCIHAHKVILESEKIHDKYIRVFGKAFGDRRGRPKEKFIALGSPKLDKVINARREDFTLPTAWERLLRRPDGTAKKVVLYNTHMFAWLNGGEEYFKKLRSVFETFRGRDDVVLWWRPHPNTELNFRTMRPDLLGAYKALVAGYRRAGFGIYDDTQDLHRAIAWTDAYYGDMSSLVAMCRCVGKPILIQSLARDDIASNKAFEKLSFDEFSVFDMYDDGEYFWFTAIEFNALFKIKKATWKTEFVGCFPDENILGWRLYTSITENNGKLYFTPCSAREIGVYDIVANQFEKINIGITKTDNDASKLEYFKKFISGFIYDDKLILIPCRFDKMVIYDIKTGELSNSTEMVDYFKSKYRGSVTSFDAQFDLCWFARWINKSEIVFNLHCNKNIAVIVNLETGEFNEYNVGNKCRTYSLIECCGDIIWLYDAPQDILVRWNNRADTYEEIDISDRLPEFKPCGPDNSFVNMISLGDQLFLVPANTNVAINVNTVTLEVAIMKELTSECLLTADGIAFYNLAKTSDNKLYLFGNKSKSFICFDRVTGELERVKVIAPDGDGIRNAFEQERFLNSLTDSNHTLSDEQVSLPNFLDIFDNAMCKNKECIVAKSDLNEGNAGKNIYDHVRRIGLGKQLSGGKDIHANYL